MRWQQIADDVILMQYPFRVFGIDFARNVTLIRLNDGRLVIHSTAPFTSDDVAAIRDFGEPGWLVDASVMHDTFAKKGHAAFAQIPYLAPPGFGDASGVTTPPLYPPPNEWDGQIDVIPIDGTRKHEHALFHRASRTLIVADLVFSFPPDSGAWARFFVRNVMRLPRLRGISVFFKMLISDRQAFERSMTKILDLDFSRMIVGHREPIESDAKAVLLRALLDRGFRLDGDMELPPARF
ncbi:MAG TPA: hypothetical protein VJ719_11270 [Chthoniobacterales bacterium]|nr:hypothetical protein [Chthoniobacterales bacterium]